jgi:glutamate-ammonia-ligase adenylyltransferase
MFEIDLQLRPYGRAGSKAVSLESFRNYFSSNGAAWEYERQALVKLRPVAGDRYFGKQLLAIRDKMLYESKSYDIAAIRAIRERQMRELVAGGTINAKFSPGALVDLEYLVQALQITHGHKDTTLRYTNTNKALKAIFNIKIISKSDFTKLNEAHIFLRKLIEALRIVRGSAKELTVPPTKSEEFAFLAKRLNYYDTSDLWDDIVNYTDSVQKINKRILG